MVEKPFRHLLLLVVGLVLFTALAVTGHLAMRQVRDATRERAIAREAVVLTSDLTVALLEIESGQRGYLLTGRPEFLQTYERGRASYPALLRRLRAHTRHVPGLRRQADATVPLIERRVALAVRRMELQGTRPPVVSQDAAVVREGNRAMTRVRDELGGLQRSLRVHIDGQSRRVESVSRTSFAVQALLGASGVIAIVSALVLLRREQRRRLAAEGDLHRANLELEARVGERTAELEAARAQLGRFAQRLDQGVEQERRRLAREVHDQLGQLITGMRMTWRSLATRYGIAPRDHNAMDELLMESVGTVRRITAQLRPPLLDEFGLADAVTFRADAFRDETGIDCEADLTGTSELDAEQATQLFRIVQEALTNVALHSNARQAWIRGRRIDSTYELVIEDDGQGMRDPRRGSAGLPNMHERAGLAGGRLELDRSPQGGLRVRVCVPLVGGGAR